MRICLVSQEYPPETGGGGIGTQTYLKAQGLSARGHEVHVVSASCDREERTYADGQAVIHRIAEPQLPLPTDEPSTYWLAYSTAVAQKLHVLTSQVPFDIIQFPEYAAEGFVYQTATWRYRTAQYVVQLHGPLGMFAEHMGWPDVGSTFHQVGCFMERTVMYHADLILASSHNTARFCAERYDYPLEQIRVIHSGIDTTKFSPQSPGEEHGFSPRILFVGNLVGNKGFNLLVDAVLRLRKRYPQICLRMIGKGEKNDVAGAHRRIADAGAQGSFQILGYVPYADLPLHYAWCDIFAGPSTYEPGPGNIYLEAMACARPVIACNTAGAPEVVLDRRTGLLVSPRDSMSLERAVEELAGDAPLRQRLGAAGRQWVVSEFSLEKYTDKVEALYDGLLKGRSPEEKGGA